MLRKFFQFALLALLLADIAAMVLLAYVILQSMKASDPSDEDMVNFTVEEGWGAKEIAINLEKEGFISNDFYFNFYIWRKGQAGNLQAGEYELSPAMTIPEIVSLLYRGEVKVQGVKITIPEGHRTSQIEDLLISGGLPVQKSELQESVGISASLAYEIFGFNFLQDLPPRATLDGFLFPDTYIFDEEAQLNDVVSKMLLNFEEKVPEALRVKIKARGKNLYEIVIMASLLEKEVRTLEDMKIVSGVLWKRMEIGMPLQVDATLAYITGKKTGEITNDDKLVDSPYNTYKYRGLPPTPIDNPGLNAIRAAVAPEESDYLYYLSTQDGETIFSEILEEHNGNKAKYLNNK